MLIFNKTSNTIISSLFPQTIVHGFGTKMSGNGRSLEEIKKYLTGQGIKYKNVIDPNQQHSNRIAVNPTADLKENCDGLITNQIGVVLTVITADCAPIIYFDATKNIVGISHNGRKGTEMKLAQKMILKFQGLGSTLQDIRVAIGPAIGACCYSMNLIKENIEQLIETGLAKDQLDFFPFCTKCDSKRFFSYRGSSDKQDFEEQFSFVTSNLAKLLIA